MATYQYCDDQSHDDTDGKFTPAVARINVWEKTSPHTIETKQSWDSCQDHISDFVELGWKSSDSPAFERISVERLSRESS